MYGYMAPGVSKILFNLFPLIPNKRTPKKQLYMERDQQENENDSFPAREEE